MPFSLRTQKIPCLITVLQICVSPQPLQLHNGHWMPTSKYKILFNTGASDLHDLNLIAGLHIWHCFADLAVQICVTWTPLHLHKWHWMRASKCAIYSQNIRPYLIPVCQICVTWTPLQGCTFGIVLQIWQFKSAWPEPHCTCISGIGWGLPNVQFIVRT